MFFLFILGRNWASRQIKLYGNVLVAHTVTHMHKANKIQAKGSKCAVHTHAPAC